MKPLRPILVGAVAAVLSACSSGGGDGGPPTITSVTISGDSTVVLKGTRQLTAVANAGGSPLTTGVTFVWPSSDTTRATVSSSGLASGVRLRTPPTTAHAGLHRTPTNHTTPP